MNDVRNEQECSKFLYLIDAQCCFHFVFKETSDIELVYMQPGKPQQNCFVDRSISSFRKELLNAYLFENLSKVRDMAYFWLLGYNAERKHESLGTLPPAASRAKLENSSSALFIKGGVDR